MSAGDARALADRCDGGLSLDNYEDQIVATLRAQADEIDRLRAEQPHALKAKLASCEEALPSARAELAALMAGRNNGAELLPGHADPGAAARWAQVIPPQVCACDRCNDELSDGNPGICANCVAGSESGLRAEIERLQAEQLSSTAVADQPTQYAYSIDGGESYHGEFTQCGEALRAAHDDLAIDHGQGTVHAVRLARLVPGVEILRRRVDALEDVADRALDYFEGVLYAEVGGSHQLITEVSREQLGRIGAALLDAVERESVISGQGLADDAAYTVTVGGGACKG